MNYALEYILLIGYLIAFMIGFSVILYSIIYYIIERVVWLKYYIIFLFTFAFLLSLRAIKLFSFLVVPNFMSGNIFNTLYFFSYCLATSLMLYFIPAFLYRFLNVKWGIKENIIYIILSMFHFSLSILGILTKFEIYIISSIIFYIAIIYIFFVGFINYKNIKDKTIKLIIKILAIITMIIYPALIYQLIIYKRKIADIGSMDITLVLFYIWWNLIMLGYLSWYFISIVKNRSMFNNNSIINNNINNENIINKNNENIDNINTESSKTINEKTGTINLTKREKEILSYLLNGKTNKEISLILDISLNTVNNHVANIYYKSNVKNRVELVNKFTK